MPTPTITEDEYKTAIAFQFGTPQGTEQQFAALIDFNWRLTAQKAPQAGTLRYLYTQEEVIRSLMLGQWQKYKWTEDGVTEDPAQVLENLQALLAAVQASIMETKAIARGGQVQSGLIAAQTPVAAPPCGPDPSSRALRGDPVQRNPFGRGGWPYDR